MRTARPLYDRIGGRYAGGRRPDRRIAARIEQALGAAASVVNVGAGTGSYEPGDRRVVAVEPSPVMAAQRPAGAAPCVRATAEALPFADGAFGAAMAILSLHHWTDKPRGLAELRRVARGPVVMFGGCEPELNTSWWLHDYFPATRRLVFARTYPPERIAAVLGPVTLIPVPIPADCVDGFEAAYWRRPDALLDPAVWAATSALSMISEAERSAGLARLAADLASGTWLATYGHLLEQDELDLGYRVIVAA
jgi:SAM-dependent methyltransferase